MKKVLISGPILSRSGYGEMARFAFRALNKQNVDLYISPTSWGNTGYLFEQTDEFKRLNQLIDKTSIYYQQANGKPVFDIAIQVSIPNEWKKIANINIGYTAGIETNMISPAWLNPSNEMDKIIVISEHAKAGFVNTIFGDNTGQQYKIKTDISRVHLPYREIKKEDFDINLKHDFNFLAVCQWGARKNLDQTIIGFLEEFKNDDVGLVLKINTANDSIIDRHITQKRLEVILNNFPNRKCSIVLLHGHLSEGQVHSLYNNSKIKAIVSTAHGEGFGLPLFEAACNELPVIAPDWSGHTDFLYLDEKRMFAKIDYELKPIAKEHVWQGVLESASHWAYPIMSSYKEKMRELFKDYGRFKSQAKKLAPWVKENFAEHKLFSEFSEKCMLKNEYDDIFSKFEKMDKI